MESNLFNRYCDLIYHSSGIVLSETKHALLENRISKRLNILGLTSRQYYLHVKEERNKGELNELIEAVSTNVTEFFRDKTHFTYLTDYICKRDKMAPLKIWCAASSTGEEPYTIAITCAEALGIHGNFEILASDINSKVLAHAKQGVYKNSATRNISQTLLRKYFMQGTGNAAGYVKVKNELKNHVKFLQLNLIKTPYPIHSLYDIIFCRNVMIYFDKETRQRIVAAFHRHTQRNGILITAHAESIAEYSRFFKTLAPSIGQRVQKDIGADIA